MTSPRDDDSARARARLPGQGGVLPRHPAAAGGVPAADGDPAARPDRRVGDRRRTPPEQAIPPGRERRVAARRAADRPACTRCGSDAVTSVQMVLTDGTPVTFVSCHACEHRAWFGEDGELSRASVLSRSAKRP